MRDFDVLLLTETRADYIPDALLPGHSIAFSPASRAGRAGEGMAIAVKKSPAYHVQDWSSDETSLWVKLLFPSGASPVIIGTCYIPPAGSRNLHEDDCESRFTKLAAHLAAAQAEGHVLLGGDFNARVAAWRTRPVHRSRRRLTLHATLMVDASLTFAPRLQFCFAQAGLQVMRLPPSPLLCMVGAVALA